MNDSIVLPCGRHLPNRLVKVEKSQLLNVIARILLTFFSSLVQ